MALRAAVLVTFVTFAASVAAGCGSSDGGGTTSSPGTGTTTAAQTATTQSTTTETSTTTAPDVTVTETTPTASTSTTPAPSGGGALTHARYVTRADAVCRRVNAAGRRLNDRARRVARTKDTDEEKLKALAPVYQDGLELQMRETAAFKAIAPPAADRPTIARYWTALDRQNDALAKVASTAAAGDADGFGPAATALNTAAADARAVVRGFGFRECGRGKAAAG